MAAIGQKLWKYDQNHRVYIRDDGTRSDSPIYIKHYVEWFIVGETSRNWIVSQRNNPELHWVIEGAEKISKKSTFKEHGFLETYQEVLDKVWLQGNRYKIADLVNGGNLTRDQLERIKAITEETPK